MHDHLGHSVFPDLGWRPRPGQWVRVRLRDLAQQVALAQAGAHAARDGSLVAIFSARHLTSATQETRSGAPVHSPAQLVPDRLMLVTPAGHNLTLPVVDPATGHGEFRDVFLHPASPGIDAVAPVDDVADLPPGRVVDTRWAESLHNSGRSQYVALPAEVHAETPHGRKAGELAALLASLVA